MSRENVEIQRKAFESFARRRDEYDAWFDRFVDEHVVLRTVNDGKAIHLQTFTDEWQAREAAGLSE